MKPEEISVLIEQTINKHIHTTQGHNEDHQFIALLIKERKARRVMWQKIKGNVIGWLIITVFGAIGTATYQYFTGK